MGWGKDWGENCGSKRKALVDPSSYWNDAKNIRPTTPAEPSSLFGICLDGFAGRKGL